VTTVLSNTTASDRVSRSLHTNLEKQILISVSMDSNIVYVGKCMFCTPPTVSRKRRHTMSSFPVSNKSRTNYLVCTVWHVSVSSLKFFYFLFTPISQIFLHPSVVIFHILQRCGISLPLPASFSVCSVHQFLKNSLHPSVVIFHIIPLSLIPHEL